MSRTFRFVFLPIKWCISEMNDQGRAQRNKKNGMIHALVRMTFPEKYHQSLVTLIPLVGVFSLGVKAQPSYLSKASPVHSYQMWVQLQMMPTYFQYLTVRHDRNAKWGDGSSHLILPITILGILSQDGKLIHSLLAGLLCHSLKKKKKRSPTGSWP